MLFFCLNFIPYFKRLLQCPAGGAIEIVFIDWLIEEPFPHRHLQTLEVNEASRDDIKIGPTSMHCRVTEGIMIEILLQTSGLCQSLLLCQFVV